MGRAKQVKDAGEGTIPVLGYGGAGSDISLSLSDANVAETLVVDAGVESVVRIVAPMVVRMSVGVLDPNVSPAPTVTTELRILADQPEYFKIPAGEAIAMITEDGSTFDTVNIIIMT